METSVCHFKNSFLEKHFTTFVNSQIIANFFLKKKICEKNYVVKMFGYFFYKTTMFTPFKNKVESTTA